MKKQYSIFVHLVKLIPFSSLVERRCQRTFRHKRPGEIGGGQGSIKGMPTLALEGSRLDREISMPVNSDRWLEEASKGLHNQGSLLVLLILNMVVG